MVFSGWDANARSSEDVTPDVPFANQNDWDGYIMSTSGSFAVYRAGTQPDGNSTTGEPLDGPYVVGLER
jgi:hypothetical protein